MKKWTIAQRVTCFLGMAKVNDRVETLLDIDRVLTGDTRAALAGTAA